MRSIIIFVSVTILLLVISCKNTSEDKDNTGDAPKDTISTNVISKTFASDLAGIDFIVTYHAVENGKEYKISSIALPGKQGADSSSVFMGFTGKKIRNFSVPASAVDKVIHLIYKMAMTDKTDYIFLQKDSVFVVHTFAGAGGALTSTTIYEFPKYPSGYDYLPYFINIEKKYNNMVNDNYYQCKNLFFSTLLFCEDNKLVK